MDDTPAEPTPAASYDDEALTPLHPDHVKVLRIQTALAAVPFLIGAGVLETAELGPRTGSFVVPVLLIAAFLIARVPLKRYQARGYAMGADRLRVVRGLMFSSDSVVPFGRVQHIDLDQGPVERMYGLATLTVHTAGTHNASVRLPGLAHDDASAMRESIRAHIRGELI